SANGQAGKEVDAPPHLHKYLNEFASRCVLRADKGRWVFERPMGGHWMSRPDRTDFTSRVVADRKDEIHVRCAGQGKFVPRFGTKAFDRQPGRGQYAQRVGVD